MCLSSILVENQDSRKGYHYFEALVLLYSFQKIEEIAWPFSLVGCWIKYLNFSYQQPNRESYKFLQIYFNNGLR